MSITKQSEADVRKSLARGRVLVSWRLLRSVGNSRAAKLTVIIPLVGYLILLNDDIVTHLVLSKDVFGDAADVALMRLLAVYVGLVCIAVASIVFAIWCPHELKRYASPEEYVAGDEPSMSERVIGRIQNRLRIGDATAREDYDAQAARGWQAGRILMNLYYEMLDRSRRVARWAAAVFYAMGFLFLLVPSARVFWRVMQVLAHRILGID